MRYGMPFQASKNTIAEKIVDFLPAGNVLVDLFAGGCAITHAALLSGKWGRVIANDINGWTEIFEMAIKGDFKGYSTVPTREEWWRDKDDDPVVRLLYSFGNNGTAYLWGKDIEPVKVWASRMLSAPSEYERRKHYRVFLKELKNWIDKHGAAKVSTPKGNGIDGLEGLERLERLQGLEGLERLQGLQGLQGLERLQRLERYSKDYREIDIPTGAVVYADPPYRGTAKCDGKDFDFVAFDEWLSGVDFPVYVSEYTAPKGCVEVAAFNRRGTMNSNKKRTVEQIFTQERFAAQQHT